MLIGVDIAEVKRFESVSDRFVETCFTKKERDGFKPKRKAESMAGSFSAKEAFAKALGTGLRGFSLNEVSVLHEDSGKPFFSFSENVKSLLNRMGIDRVDVTISHDGGFAIAVVSANQSKGAEVLPDVLSRTDVADDAIITYDLVRASLPPRRSNLHKGDCGRIFLVAGSKGLTGAGIMASRGALLSGGGLITLGCPDSLNSIFETALHEVMTYPMKDESGVLTAGCAESLLKKASASDVLAFGCGLSGHEKIYDVLERVLPKLRCPIVIDADGLNALSRNIDILRAAEVPVILTPHIGEFSRLTGMSADEIYADRCKAASDFAIKRSVTVVLKSDRTVVAHPNGSVRCNLLGNSGMATGGSGDVLTGIIASFIGQGIANPVEAAVYIHSLSADIVAAKKGIYGLTPTDMIEAIPYAIKLISGK